MLTFKIPVKIQSPKVGQQEKERESQREKTKISPFNNLAQKNIVLHNYTLKEQLLTVLP